MGNSQSEQEQQKKRSAERKDVEKKTRGGAEPQTHAERGTMRPTTAKGTAPTRASTAPEPPKQPKHTPEVSAGVGPRLLPLAAECPSQPVTSTNPSPSSACPVVKNSRTEQTAPSISKIQNTCQEQQMQSPSGILCSSSGGSTMAASPTPPNVMPAPPPVPPPSVLNAAADVCQPSTAPSVLNAAAERVCQPSTAPRSSGKDASAVVKEASPQPSFPGTTEPLESKDHNLKVTNRLEPTTATPTGSHSTTTVLQSETQVQVPSSTTAAPLETTAKCTCNKGSDGLSGGAQCSEEPENVESQHLNLLAQIDSRIEYVMKQEVLPKVQMQAAVRRALKGVPYQEAVKGTSPKVNPARRESKRRQIMKKVRMNRSTNKQTTQLEHSHHFTPVPSPRNTTKGVSDTLGRLSSEQSVMPRTRVQLMRQSKSKMATEIEEMVHSANDMGRNEGTQIVVPTEVREGGAITCTARSNNKLVTEMSKTANNVYTFGESNLDAFPQSFNYIFVPECKGQVDAFHQVTQCSAPQPQPSLSAACLNSSFSFGPLRMGPLISKASDDGAPGGVKVFADPTSTSEIGLVLPKVGLDIPEDPPSSPAPLCPQPAVRRKHTGKVKKDMIGRAEVVKEVTTEEASPLHNRPEGRWHPFTTDLVCSRRVWCSHRGLPELPPNVRRWFDVKHNYLCEPPWVTTATLAASVALRVRQENRDLCLWT